jgi:hypothetical protein
MRNHADTSLGKYYTAITKEEDRHTKHVLHCYTCEPSADSGVLRSRNTCTTCSLGATWYEHVRYTCRCHDERKKKETRKSIRESTGKNRTTYERTSGRDRIGMPGRPGSPRRGISRHKGKTKGPRALGLAPSNAPTSGRYVARTLKRRRSAAGGLSRASAGADERQRGSPFLHFSISRFLRFPPNEDLRSAISRRQRPAAASASPPRICERIGLIRSKERTERIRLKTRGAD